MVKKITILIFGAFLMSVPAMEAGIAPLKQEKHQKVNMVDRQKFLKEQVVPAGRSSMRLPMEETDVITNPEGIIKYYTVDAAGIAYGYEYSDAGLASHIIYGEDNKVYFYNIIPSSGLGEYVLGISDGENVTIDLPQMAYFDEVYDYGYYITLMKYDSAEDTYIPVEGSVSYFIADDGDMVLELPGDEIGEYILGLIDSSNEEWTELGDYSQVYSPIEEEVTSLPANVKTETYYFINGVYGKPIEVGFEANKIYIVGLNSDIVSSAVIIADLEGSIASIPQNQLIGNYSTYFVYTKCVVPTIDQYGETSFELLPSYEDCKLSVDMENKLITYSNPDVYFCINADKEDLFYLEVYEGFKIQTQENMNGQPMNPFALSFSDDYFEYYGYYSFYFTIPNISVEGNVLDSANMFYKIFVNEEVFEFEENSSYGEYIGLRIPTTEIPYDFTNYNDFFMWDNADREVGFYIDGISTLGVQTIYKNGEITTESSIVTLDIETGNITTGIESEMSVKEVVSSQYYNLNGQLVNNPDKGIYIKCMTLSNGEILRNKVVFN